MKATFRTRSGRLSFEVVGETATELFAQIGDIQEVFDAETACGICGSQDLTYHHRVAQSYDFYEMHCTCGARFNFGQNKTIKGNLFPKRRERPAKGQPYRDLPNGGWYTWNGRNIDPDEGEYDPDPPFTPPAAREAGPVAAPATRPAPISGPGPTAAPVAAQQPRQAPTAGTRQDPAQLPYESQEPPPPGRRRY